MVEDSNHFSVPTTWPEDGPFKITAWALHEEKFSPPALQKLIVPKPGEVKDQAALAMARPNERTLAIELEEKVAIKEGCIVFGRAMLSSSGQLKIYVAASTCSSISWPGMSERIQVCVN